MGPRALLPFLLVSLVFALAALAGVPATITAAFVAGAVGGAVAALVVCWKATPDVVRPFVLDNVRSRVLGR